MDELRKFLALIVVMGPLGYDMALLQSSILHGEFCSACVKED